MSLILSGSDGLSDIDGSASTPAIRGTDTNTGIFFPAADTIAFSEGGAEVMRIDSSGNVGIGTTSPASRLQVHTAGSNYSIVQITNGDTGSTVNDGLHIGMDNNGTTAAFNIRDAGGVLVFRTQDAERARITSAGELLVGTTSAYGSEAYAGYRADAAVFQFDRGNDGTLGVFRRGGTLVGSISVTASATAYNTSSDYRLKENIAPMTGALATVSALKPVTYKWKIDGSSGQGFIAHELQEVVPDCVTGAKDAVDAEGNPQYQGVDTSFLVATLTAAIQELKAELDTVKAQNAAFEARLAALEAK